ncbi:HAMP domain-containing sensor histidine kinase [Cytophagaceae bacterium ABcell3]|nr:HAMP domain-containing sensor histidine kinase [Cytophagaceae bacterium ABcell3]
MLRHRYWFLVSGLVLITTAVIFGFFLSDRDKPDNETLLQYVNENVNRELQAAHSENARIKKLLKDTEVPVFSTLIQDSKFPYFIFRNKQLYFWSDSKYNFHHDLLHGDFSVKYAELKNGKHLLVKDQIIKRGDLFEVCVLIPLTSEYPVENQYLQPGLNPTIFESVNVSVEGLSPLGKVVSDNDGNFLFSISFNDEDFSEHASYKWYVLFLTFAGIACVLIFIYLLVTWLNLNQHTDLSFVVFFLSVVAIRGLMLIFDFPFAIIEFKLFDSKYFASSVMDPSIGDLFLNALFFFLFSCFLYNNYSKSVFIKKLYKLSVFNKNIVSVFLVVLYFLGVFFLFFLLRVLYFDSLWSLDITASISFDVFRIVSILIFILSSCTFFIYSHILSRLFISIHKGNFKSGIINALLGFLAFGIFTLVIGVFHGFLLIIAFAYFVIVTYNNLPKIDYYLRYSTYVYLIFAALICSIIGAYSIYEVNVRTSVIGKQKFAGSLLMENDVVGEFYLNQAANKIAGDQFIKNKFFEPFSSNDIIEQKIRKVYLNSYLDKYDIEVHLFDGNGDNYKEETEYPNILSITEKYRRGEFRTEYDNIYFINDPGAHGLIKYFSFTEIEKYGVTIGYVLIELKHKRFLLHSVYPELLMDKNLLEPMQTKDYSYAIYNNKELVFYTGPYNYSLNFSSSNFNNPRIFNDGILQDDHHHLCIKSGSDKIIVVSSEKYFVKDSYSNFSFLFLILIVSVLVFITFYGFYYKFKNINTTFSTKIQLYLNLAFFLPLFIVSMTTLSVISANYNRNLNKSFIKKAESVSQNLSVFLDKYRKQKVRKEFVEHLMYEIAQYADSDINLFNRKGHLIFSNQPMIYESGLFARLVNPAAYAAILEDRNNVVMLPEEIGELRYNAVYVAVKSPDRGELMGILSIPFFESKYEIEKQLIEVLTTILNIFTSIFIVFLFISYFFSSGLTYPLKLITQRIRKTSLSGYNEPLEWNSRDEIGLLVGEYNKMLKKLEESKEALSKSEKESAWREMARQVAHEIKNPLTPMKLTVQHLQRKAKENPGDSNASVSKYMNVLLDQIDNLSEIATSFSMFAKMPIPVYERYELVKVVRSTASLHNTAKSKVSIDLPEEDVFVMGDEKLMSGIVTNLILNGIQSASSDVFPEILVKLRVHGKKAILEISDNGTGIPDEIRDKVFLPNFSTKYTGSGIGLAVAKRGVEHAHGKIWFETMESHGTTFFIELPVVN